MTEDARMAQARELAEEVYSSYCDTYSPDLGAAAILTYGDQCRAEGRAEADKELAEIKAARARIHAQFSDPATRTPDGKCQCPYCRGDANDLAEMAAEYEMELHWKSDQLKESEIENTTLRQRVTALEQALKLTPSEQHEIELVRIILTKKRQRHGGVVTGSPHVQKLFAIVERLQSALNPVALSGAAETGET